MSVDPRDQCRQPFTSHIAIFTATVNAAIGEQHSMPRKGEIKLYLGEVTWALRRKKVVTNPKSPKFTPASQPRSQRARPVSNCLRPTQPRPHSAATRTGYLPSTTTFVLPFTNHYKCFTTRVPEFPTDKQPIVNVWNEILHEQEHIQSGHRPLRLIPHFGTCQCLA